MSDHIPFSAELHFVSAAFNLQNADPLEVTRPVSKYCTHKVNGMANVDFTMSVAASIMPNRVLFDGSKRWVPLSADRPEGATRTGEQCRHDCKASPSRHNTEGAVRLYSANQQLPRSSGTSRFITIIPKPH